MDPSSISSFNYFSTLTTAELHNCVTMHKQSIALMSADSNAQKTHINKKQKITNFNNHYQISYQRSQSQQSLSTLCDYSTEKSQHSDKNSSTITTTQKNLLQHLHNILYRQ